MDISINNRTIKKKNNGHSASRHSRSIRFRDNYRPHISFSHIATSAKLLIEFSDIITHAQTYNIRIPSSSKTPLFLYRLHVTAITIIIVHYRMTGDKPLAKFSLEYTSRSSRGLFRTQPPRRVISNYTRQAPLLHAG